MNIYIKTFGCALNQADSAFLKAILTKNKFNIVSSLENAGIVIVNSCGVKSTTQNRVISFINKIPESKKIFIGGCLPKMLDIKKYVKKVDGIFDTNSIKKIIELIKEDKKEFFSDKKEHKIGHPLIEKNKLAIIPIAEGCLGNCSYCSVKSARGDLKSYKKADIIKAVKKAVKANCKKICLTAQDTGCWGLDIKDNLPNLLKDVIKIKGDFKIRLGMANPTHIKRYLKDLIKIYKSDKMIKFLHIPIQSGSNKIIKDMNRNYKAEDFKEIVKKFRGEIPNMNISTDIIVGYPTETEQDFSKTIKLIEEIKPEVLNISKFGPRPKTKASKLKQLTSQEIKNRSVRITKEYKKLKKN